MAPAGQAARGIGNKTGEVPLRVSFTAFDADNKVAEFGSDRNGRFEVSLLLRSGSTLA